MKPHALLLSTTLLISTCIPGMAEPAPPIAPRDSAHLFWSGHSLMDQPIPGYVASIAGSLGLSHDWNRQYVVGSSIEVRTRGRPPRPDGWDGYRQGYNRGAENMDVIAELREPRRVEGGRYDTLVITEVHTILGALQGGDTVRLLRHYHDRFIDGNAQGRTFFYESWLGLHDKGEPAPWIEYERAASRVWECIAARVNHGLAAAGRPDRIASLPAGRALAALIESAVAPGGLPGISAASTRETVDRLVKDDVHLTELGSYYVALVVVGYVHGRSPVGAWAPDGVDTSTARTLQAYAWDFVERERQHEPMTDMAACRAMIHDDFASRYWHYMYRSYDLWATGNALVRQAKRWRHVVYRWRDIRATQALMNQQDHGNPLYIDPTGDTTPWHGP